MASLRRDELLQRRGDEERDEPLAEKFDRWLQPAPPTYRTKSVYVTACIMSGMMPPKLIVCVPGGSGRSMM